MEQSIIAVSNYHIKSNMSQSNERRRRLHDISDTHEQGSKFLINNKIEKKNKNNSLPNILL